MDHPYGWIASDLQALHRAGWYRSTRLSHGSGSAQIELEGRRVLQFASNDYLGLSKDSRLVSAAIDALRIHGAGATGSRLLSGEREPHRQLEKRLATWKGCEDCLVFSSGYLANLGVIPALVGSRDLVLADEYNHSSLKSGTQLSGAQSLTYPHGDMAQLEEELVRHRGAHRRCLICTDTVFSMDGDLAPLPRLIEVAERFRCMVLVDEAHATGVLGPTGAGALEHFGLAPSLVQMGTLSKALGSLGGYVCGSAELIDYLRNRARSWVYTTGLSPADTAAALTAVDIVRSEPELRTRLWQNIARLQAGFTERQLTLLPTNSAVLCIRVGDVERTRRFADALREAGVYAPAIRPPTVPTSRIRFSVMATHTPEMIDRLLAAIDCVL
ncbi:MAG: 8-amino-7-oxononanoate synthase [Gemmatimonadaceae bacterium]|nr:8-amino-7-oxononanoate synthase [Gloeobacterales cyanobacterium ES-bin-141]